jgi:N4-gp56 family major capsid protein
MPLRFRVNRVKAKTKNKEVEMPAQSTTYGDISPRTAGYATKKLLERGKHLMVTEKFGMFDPQGENKTTTRKYRRFKSLQRASAPLAEGVPPVGQKLEAEDVECTLEQYGDAVKITDVIADTHEDPVLNESMELCGEQAGETVEELRINVLRAGTNVFYANNVANRVSVASKPLLGDLRQIYRYFKKYKAREVSRIISATAKIATEPVGSAYFAMGHTDLDADLRGIAGFVPVEKYSDSMKAQPGEIGKVENFRFILTPMFEPWLSSGASSSTLIRGGAVSGSAASCDVYPLIFVAQNAYAIVPLAGRNAVKPMVLNPGKPSTTDPLGQIGFVSWKTYQTAVILNHSWIARLECGATANPS